MSGTIRLGILAGLRSEARCLSPGNIERAVALSGARPEGAARAVERLLGFGATHLVSFGLAGGLDPALAPGTLLLPRRLVGPTGLVELNPDWHAAALAGLAPLRPVVGLHLGSDEPLASPSAKAAAFGATGAAGVDMESQFLARTGLPFLVVRVVCDRAVDRLPPAALAGVDETGRTVIGPVIGSLLRNPGQLPDLIRLGRASARAHAVLREVAGRIPDFTAP